MRALLTLLLSLGVAHATPAHPPADTLQYFFKRESSCPNESRVAGSNFCVANTPRITFIPEAPNHTCPSGFVRAGSGYCRKTMPTR